VCRHHTVIGPQSHMAETSPLFFSTISTYSTPTQFSVWYGGLQGIFLNSVGVTVPAQAAPGLSTSMSCVLMPRQRLCHVVVTPLHCRRRGEGLLHNMMRECSTRGLCDIPYCSKRFALQNICVDQKYFLGLKFIVCVAYRNFLGFSKIICVLLCSI